MDRSAASLCRAGSGLGRRRGLVAIGSGKVVFTEQRDDPAVDSFCLEPVAIGRATPSARHGDRPAGLWWAYSALAGARSSARRAMDASLDVVWLSGV